MERAGNDEKKRLPARSWLTVLCPFKPPSHPAARQATPFHLSRYVLLALYTIVSILTAGVYFNWSAMADMLFRNDAFEYLCKRGPITGTYLVDLRQTGKAFICNQQDSAVQRLFSITMASNFIVSAIAGAILDFCGMKLTALLGLTLHGIGWLLLAFASPYFNSYYAGFIFLGAACDTGFLPALVIANLFPGDVGLVITILGSAAALSFAVPLVMNEAWLAHLDWTFRFLCCGYIILILLPCCVIVALSMPWRSFLGIDKFPCDTKGVTATQRPAAGEEERGKKLHLDDVVWRGSTKISDEALELAADCRDEEGTQVPAGETAAGEKQPSATSFTPDTTSFPLQTGPRRRSAAASSGLRHAHPPPHQPETMESFETRANDADVVSEREASSLFSHSPPPLSEPKNKAQRSVVDHPADVAGDETGVRGFGDTPETLCSQEDNWDVVVISSAAPVEAAAPTFLSQFFSPAYVAICVYFVVVSWAVSYYSQAAGSRLFTSEAVVYVLRIVTPLSCVPCVILGKLVDFVGILIILGVVNVSGILTYVFVLIRTDATGYISTVWYGIYVALFTSQMVCYIESAFDSKHFGKLVGICTMVGGLMSLLVIPLYENLTVEHLNGNPEPVCIAFVVILAAMFPLIWLMSRLRVRRCAQAQIC